MMRGREERREGKKIFGEVGNEVFQKSHKKLTG